MNITKDTTDEEILAPVLLAKTALGTKLQKGEVMDSEALAKEVNHIAGMEGQAKARYEYRNALQFDASPDAIHRMLARLLTVGADDTWSGRVNDVRRAKFDGLRAEVSEIIGTLR